MKPQPHPPALRSAAGNAEERAAQIQRIKERLDRLEGNAHYVAAEIVVLAREIKTLTASEGAPNPSAFPSHKLNN
jgi:hypothetical protein